jgi:hypothetical protein
MVYVSEKVMIFEKVDLGKINDLQLRLPTEV